MNNIINIFFLCAHYAMYIYLVFLIYRKFVRPYLIAEQQQERALLVQLEQKLSTAQNLMKVFKAQTQYLTTVFKKLSEQQKQAHERIAACETEQCQAQAAAQAAYAEQQRIIAHNRNLNQLHQALAPEVMQELLLELKRYAQDHGKHYLDASLQELKKQARFKSKR